MERTVCTFPNANNPCIDQFGKSTSTDNYQVYPKHLIMQLAVSKDVDIYSHVSEFTSYHEMRCCDCILIEQLY